MKLIYYVIIRISLVLSVLLTVWAVFFYFAIMDEVNDEVDDSLENYSEIIMATFVSLFIKAETIRKVGLPIKDFFIWSDDLEYTRRIS